MNKGLKIVIGAIIGIVIGVVVAVYAGSAFRETHVSDEELALGSIKRLSIDEIAIVMGETKNMTRFLTFIDNVEAQRPDKIRLKNITIEGDPIYTLYNYDGKQIQMVVDNSEDKFGEATLYKDSCEGIRQEKINGIMTYYITGCQQVEEYDIIL